MRNLLLTLRYDGTHFHGWQIQNNGDTVEARVKAAFNSVSGKSENIIGCSRTDAGVHANMFCCNVRTDCTVPADKIPNALNFYLPESISVYDCREVDFDFHARFNAKGKEYVYLIYNDKYRNPFYENKALFYPYPLDVNEMNKNAKDFIGTFDFSAFCSADSEVQDKVREISECKAEKDGNLIKITVRGNGFLYNMVRIMVGTLLYIQNGKIESGTIPQIIESKDRNRAGVTAKPEGLYLNKVFY
ncbi:MAG: tRNA pseudouridine(38-40) synthase TruA [Oscillospiraceae bacterium]|nr:tRNA pseudouridine(38-40) synthase TruA [Oscillospiraceae bacterium]